jgi:hypothetical protein
MPKNRQKEVKDLVTKAHNSWEASMLYAQADILERVYKNWWDTPQLTAENHATFIDKNLVMLPLKLRKEAAKLKENA